MMSNSASFRDFLLKPELIRALSDAGYECPLQGTQTHNSSALHQH